MKILVADDSKTNLSLITLSLQRLGHKVITATTGLKAIERLQENLPDLIILDVVMEGMNGFECAKKIRSEILTDWIPIIFLSGSVDDENFAKGIDAGGDDYLTKPFSEIKLAAKINAMQRIANMRNELYETTQKLATLSLTDTLTGISNRLQFNKTIVERIAHANRYNCFFALLFLDLDKFKSINDTLGHLAGDYLLIEVGRRLKACLRLDDFVARMGGDEFAILISGNDHKNEVDDIANKIISTLSASYDYEGNTLMSGCSIGIVFYPEDGHSPEALLKHADIAMYQAKHTGHNMYKRFNHTDSRLNTIPLPSNNYPQTITPTVKQKLTVLNCLINTTQICIDLSCVKSCLLLPKLQTMPNSPVYMVGFMNLAGKSVPIVDLSAYLNLQHPNDYSLDTPIIYCAIDTNDVGFIVDEIVGIVEIDDNNIKKLSDLNQKDMLFSAILTIDSALSLLINNHYLLGNNYFDKQHEFTVSRLSNIYLSDRHD